MDRFELEVIEKYNRDTTDTFLKEILINLISSKESTKSFLANYAATCSDTGVKHECKGLVEKLGIDIDIIQSTIYPEFTTMEE